MLFDRDTQKPAEPKKRSLMGLLFNPDFGASIRPIGESIGMFVRLVANLFVINGLFPKNHPALTTNDSRYRLTMGEVLGTAWRNLSFTKEGAFQVFVFFAVVSSLAIGVFAVLSLLVGIFMGQAHAADGMFTPPDTTHDLSHNWLGYLFEGQNMTLNYPNEDGSSTIMNHPPQPQTLQTALRTAMAYYSTAILVFAGIILIYHLTVMIAETAHSGVPMGRNANQIWAPIRLVFAIGLLVPISGGLNTGQYIAIQMADWGGGLASNVWKTFLDAVAEQTKYKYVQPPVGNVGRVVQGMVLTIACQNMYNAYNTQGGGSSSEELKLAEDSANAIRYSYHYDLPGIKQACGGYSVPNPANYSDSKAQTLINGGITAFRDLITAVEAAVPDTTKYFIKGTSDYSTVQIPNNGFMYKLVSDYYDSLLKNTEKAYGNTDSKISDIAKTWSGLGWVAAGAFFNTISRTQQIAVNVAQDQIPQVTVPQLMLYGGHSSSSALPAFMSTANSLSQYAYWMQNGYSNTNSKSVDAADYSRLGLDASYGRKPIDIKDSNALLNTVFDLAEKVGSKDQVWIRDYSALTLGSSGDPFSELAALGHKNFVAAFDLLNESLAYAGGSSWAAVFLQEWSKAHVNSNNPGEKAARDGMLAGMGATAASSISAAIMTLATILSTFLFTSGLMLGYFIPLLPFSVFFFNVIAWVVSVFESVLSMPLWALAHLTTKGEGLPGDMARQGYFFLFSIFLRPVLMIFGLIAGILIFYIAISFLNATYTIAVQGAFPDFRASPSTQATADVTRTIGHYATLARIIFNVIYCLFAYICANSAFKTVNFFPEHAMRWMSSQGVQTEKMGDKQLMSQAMTGITAYAFKDTIANTVGSHPGLAQAGKVLDSVKDVAKNHGIDGDSFSKMMRGDKGIQSKFAQEMKSEKGGADLVDALARGLNGPSQSPDSVGGGGSPQAIPGSSHGDSSKSIGQAEGAAGAQSLPDHSPSGGPQSLPAGEGGQGRNLPPMTGADQGGNGEQPKGLPDAQNEKSKGRKNESQFVLPDTD